VTADGGGAKVRYRLLETARAYSLEKLVEAGEFDAAARRHARRYLDLFESAEAEAETRPTDEWLAEYAPRIDNLRAALDWAFSPGGDTSIGVALTAAAVPLSRRSESRTSSYSATSCRRRSAPATSWSCRRPQPIEARGEQDGKHHPYVISFLERTTGVYQGVCIFPKR